jgi:hypothetical protein
VSSYTGIVGANVLSNQKAGIEVTYCTGLNISTSMIRNNMRQGIVLGTGPQFSECTNCSIIGNQVHLNSREDKAKYSEIDVGYGSANTRIIGNYCGDVHTSDAYPTAAKYGIWLHDGSKHTVVVGNACPAGETVEGGFFAEAGSTYSAIANTGIADTYVQNGLTKTERLAANGGSIGTISAMGRDTFWVGITGAGGGTVSLPPSSGLAAGASVVIKDEGGGAGQKHITVEGNGATIDGQPTMTLATNYAAVHLRYDGKAWWTW